MTMNIKTAFCCILLSNVYASNKTTEILNSLKDITANYSMQTYNKKGQLTFEDQGTLKLHSLNELKFTSNVNKGSFVMLKDNCLLEYDDDLLQLTKIDLSKKKPAAINLLEKINSYSEAKELTNKGYELHLTKSNMPNINLYVENNILTYVEFYDNFGYVNKLYFTNILPDAEIPEDTFVFTPKEDVDIIKT